MKCKVLLMLAGLAFMAVHAKSEPESLASKLSKMFYIDLRKAEMCVLKTAVTMDDLDALQHVVTIRDKPPVDQKSIRRASCTLTCCAQIQGIMTGNKIELEVIQMLFQLFIPRDVKDAANTALLVCNDEGEEVYKSVQHVFFKLLFPDDSDFTLSLPCVFSEVKSIIDECDVSFAFLRCMIFQSENFDI